MLKTAEQSPQAPIVDRTTSTSFTHLVIQRLRALLHEQVLVVEAKELLPLSSIKIFNAIKKLESARDNQPIISEERKRTVRTYTLDQRPTKQMQTSIHTNILYASITRFMQVLEEFQRMGIPTEFYAEVIDDEDCPIKRTDFSYTNAVRLTQIINQTCVGFLYAEVKIAEIAVLPERENLKQSEPRETKVVIPTEQSHYRVKITVV